VTLVAVGVGDSVDSLISGHVSIQRNLAQVRMPRMNGEEIEGILDKGLDNLGLKIEENGRRFIRVVPLRAPAVCASPGPGRGAPGTGQG